MNWTLLLGLVLLSACIVILVISGWPWFMEWWRKR